MRIFIIHRGSDFKRVKKLKEDVEKTVDVQLLALLSKKEDTEWMKEAKAKIDQSDLVLYALGAKTHESKNVDDEIKYALKKKKRILLYRLNPKSKDKINSCLFVKDSYNNTDKKLFKEIELEDLNRIIQYGYDFDIGQQLDKTKSPKRESELIEQYKVYLQTSEEVLNRRQNTSNFYTTLNTTMLTIVVTVIGALFSLSQFNSQLIIALLLLAVGVVGILLNFNWLCLLESYGRLNGAKIKVISEMEKNLPANIFDTEWKVMSEKLYGGKYVSFTAIEKRLPACFAVLYGLLLIASIVLLILAVR